MIRDGYTGVIQAYPSARKNADAMIRAAKQFMGRRTIREANESPEDPSGSIIGGKDEAQLLGGEEQSVLASGYYNLLIGGRNSTMLLEVRQSPS